MDEEEPRLDLRLATMPLTVTRMRCVVMPPLSCLVLRTASARQFGGWTVHQLSPGHE